MSDNLRALIAANEQLRVLHDQIIATRPDVAELVFRAGVNIADAVGKLVTRSPGLEASS